MDKGLYANYKKVILNKNIFFGNLQTYLAKDAILSTRKKCLYEKKTFSSNSPYPLVWGLTDVILSLKLGNVKGSQ